MKKLNSRVIDVILLIIGAGLLGWFGYTMYKVSSLPFKWRIVAFAICALVYLIMLFIDIKKLEKAWKIWLRRIFTVAVCIFLAVASLYIGKLTSAVNGITNTGSNDKHVSISVISLKTSKYSKLSDLQGKTVGYQTNLDKDNASYAKKKINSEVSGISFKSGDNYISLANELNDGTIDALIITDSYLANLDDSIDNFNTTITKIKTYQRKVTVSATKGSSKDLTKHVFTVLLSGVDTTDTGEESLRSDVNMILIVNPMTNHVEMASIPRDSYIPNVALNYGNDKLTHTGNNGISNIVDSVENLVGFKIDFYVQVNFTSVIKIVNAIGGIDVNVPISFCEQNSERSFADSDLICLNAGEQHLNGEQALALARHRHSYTDLQRNEAQQLVIKAMINKCLSSEGASKVPGLLDILPDYIKTNVSSSQLNSFINSELDNMGTWSFSSTSLENGVSDNLATASMGSTLLSCYVLNINDLQTLWTRYQMMKNPTTFAKFTFDISSLDTADGVSTYSPPEGLLYTSTANAYDYNETTDSSYSTDYNYSTNNGY